VDLREEFSLARADCEYRAPLSPRLARPTLMLVDAIGGVNEVETGSKPKGRVVVADLKPATIWGSAVHFEDTQEGFLGYLDSAHSFHALLALSLLLEKFALASDVAAVALG